MIVLLKPLCTKSRSGFTIVEFMVATMVFGVVMLAVSAAIIQISKTYQRSMNMSRTQAATRQVVDTLAQAIQYSSSDFRAIGNSSVSGYCSSSAEFWYVLGKKVSTVASSTTTRNAVVILPSGSASCPPAAVLGIDTLSSLPAGYQSLLGPGMRLANLVISKSNLSSGIEMYTITARVIYGGDELLTVPANATNAKCVGGAGSEYCSVSELSTTVQRRL